MVDLNAHTRSYLILYFLIPPHQAIFQFLALKGHNQLYTFLPLEEKFALGGLIKPYIIYF